MSAEQIHEAPAGQRIDDKHMRGRWIRCHRNTLDAQLQLLSALARLSGSAEIAAPVASAPYSRLREIAI